MEEPPDQSISTLEKRAAIGVISPMKKRIAMPLVLIACAASFAGDAAVKLTKDDKKITVELGDKPFTTYWYNDGNGGPNIRPFFFPVLAADGVEVTSDQIASKDHPHHRSMWIAH